jgi:hypothetical protein
LSYPVQKMIAKRFAEVRKNFREAGSMIKLKLFLKSNAAWTR